MIFVVRTILITLFFQTEISSVEFRNIKVNKEHNALIEKLFSVMGKAYSICLWDSKQSNDLLDSVFKQCFQKIITISVVTKSTKSIQNCEVLVFLKASIANICRLFLKNKFVSLTFDHKIFITNESLSDEFLRKVEFCASTFDPASVTIITLQPEIWVLDSSMGVHQRFRSRINQTGSLTSSLNKLHGRIVNVATFHYPPFIEITRNGSLVEYNGMEMNLWKELSMYLNCTWKIVEMEKGWEWGVPLENGTLVGGIVQALREGAADVSFCNIWQQDDLLNTMDFGPLMNKISLKFIVRRPHQISDRWRSLVSVAQTDVWWTTLATLLAITVVYWCACALDVPVSSTKTVLSGLTESLLVMFGILTISSSYIRSTSTNVRVVVLGWFFFTMLLTTAITSTLVTRLTLPIYSPRIDTFQQLVEGDFYWTSSYYQDVGTAHKEFYFDVNSYWQMKFEANYRSVKTKDLDKLIETDVKLVLPAQQMGSEYIIINIAGVNGTTDLSNFRVIKSSARDTSTSFAFRKRSPYNELFIRTIQRFIDLGLWSYWKKQTDQSAVRKHLLVEQDVSLFNEPEQLTLQKLYPVFLILCIGHCIVCVVFVIEYFS